MYIANAPTEGATNSAVHVASGITRLGGAIDSEIAQTTYNGSISGTAVWSMPFQGSSYKKFIIYYNALHDAGGTISFPTAFAHTPVVSGDTTATAITTASTTTLTIAVAGTVSGFAFVEGY